LFYSFSGVCFFGHRINENIYRGWENPELFKEKMKMRRSNTKMIRNYRPIGIDGIGTLDGGDMLGYGLMMSLWFNM